ncbi:MAG: carboxypeptidase regulatory-like domain-containing protein [Anaerolineae bacterium]|nr:carboxypeptidase regulatory-like domain-containing protein [Anaerolineae bacterium]MCB0204053.1 carboxypeptidase regulatory-like domain-containing protein [Anaerolineae bacterium]MCB0256748.1 carboxypeptidase regulatory-like domain-containing protein [Anaerolineae bacterium]
MLSPNRDQSTNRPIVAKIILILALAVALVAACSTDRTETTETPQALATGSPQAETVAQETATIARVAATETPTMQPSPTATGTPTPVPTDTPVPLASVTGRVLDESTGQPIAGVNVSVGGLEVTTMDDGQFVAERLGPGQYVVVAEHPDYAPFVSNILVLKSGETRHIDMPMSTIGASKVPRDPMASNQIDPDGAPTAADAERLARDQGFEGPVVSVEKTVLEGVYLVNYKERDSLRAASAALHHPAWELIDQNGLSWYIIEVCGNLAVTKPPQAQVPDSYIVRPNPVITVGEESIPGYVCPAETCEVVTTLPAGWYGATLGCSQECQWIWVQVQGLPGGCWIQASGLVVYGDTGELMAIPGEMHWSDAEWIGPGSGFTEQLLIDKQQLLWAFWEEHAFTTEHVYEAVHYRTWNGTSWNEMEDIPGSENTGETLATVLQDGSILVGSLRPIDVLSNNWQYVWFRWTNGYWSPLPDLAHPFGTSITFAVASADGYGNIHLLGPMNEIWNGSGWQETQSLGATVGQPGAVAVDSTGNVHVATANQQGVRHWTWDGSSWSSETVYNVASPNEVLHYEVGLAIGPDGALHIVWVSTTPRPMQTSMTPPPPRPHRLLYSHRTADGWTQPVTIFETDTDDGAFGPDVAVLPDGLVVAVIGDVYTAIEGLNTGVYVTWGINDIWAEPVRISPDIKFNPAFPSLAVDANGQVHVLFSDLGYRGVYHVLGTRSGM